MPGNNPNAGRQFLIACHYCDALNAEKPIRPNTTLKCGRCGSVLYRSPRESSQQILALALTEVVLFVLANAFPLLELKLFGNVYSASILQAVMVLYKLGFWELSILLFLMVFLFPALKLFLMLFVLLPLQFNRKLPGMITAMAWLQRIMIWGLIDVFLLATFVALSKMVSLADVQVGIALYAIISWFILRVLIEKALNTHSIWERIGEKNCPTKTLSSKKNVLMNCRTCHALCAVPEKSAGGRHRWECPRCGASLVVRKKKSISRTWAYLISAAVLYIPANILPMMNIKYMGRELHRTIIGGIISLFNDGSWPLAVIIFVASICIPLLKILVLSVLLVTIHLKASWNPRHRTFFYRIVDFIGRWSMLDVFATSLLATLVRFGQLVEITPGYGAIAFAAVVVITMFAAFSFDPRVIWDNAAPRNELPDSRPEGGRSITLPSGNGQGRGENHGREARERIP